MHSSTIHTKNLLLTTGEGYFIINIKGCQKKEQKRYSSGENRGGYIFILRLNSHDAKFPKISKDKRFSFAIHKHRANVLDFLVSRFCSSRLLNP